MSTKPIKLGESGKGTTKPRQYGNNASEVLQKSGAEFFETRIIERLELITTNQVNGEDAIQGLCAEIVHDAYTYLRSLEKIGAVTDPIKKIENTVFQARVCIPV